jgi:hypothetical protein
MSDDKPAMVANAIRGPIILITIGALFLLDRMTSLTFSQTWPVILIVTGALALTGSGGRWRGRRPNDGTRGSQQ